MVRNYEMQFLVELAEGPLYGPILHRPFLKTEWNVHLKGHYIMTRRIDKRDYTLSAKNRQKVAPTHSHVHTIHCGSNPGSCALHSENKALAPTVGLEYQKLLLCTTLSPGMLCRFDFMLDLDSSKLIQMMVSRNQPSETPAQHKDICVKNEN
jgi:hypothetical protein